MINEDSTASLRVFDWFEPKRLLLAAAIFHVALTMAIFGLGRLEVLPGSFDRDGIPLAFEDARKWCDGAAGLSEMLALGEIAQWASAPVPFHVKLYSISFTLLTPFLGPNILSAEPVNLFCYLAILTCVYFLGREIFDRRAGLLAALMVALLPTFLLHTTQVLRDQLFIIEILVFLLIAVSGLKKTFSRNEAICVCLAGSSLAALVWLTRPTQIGIVFLALLLELGLLAAKQLYERHFQPTNLVAFTFILGATIGVVQIIPEFKIKKPELPQLKAAQPEFVLPEGKIAARLAGLRYNFVKTYAAEGSNIDVDVRFESAADILCYLPRAAMIGFFAPFPDMWLEAGKKVGSSGRLLAGIETLWMYLVEALAFWVVWKRRREASVWLLFLISAIWLCALGFIVINIGALYRMRYLLLIILMILAGEGAKQILQWLAGQKRKTQEPAPAA